MAFAVWYLVSVLLVAGVAMADGGPGGLDKIRPVDNDAKDAFEAVKPCVASKVQVDEATLKPEEYALQPTNDGFKIFFIRIRITNRTTDKYIFARIQRNREGQFLLRDTRMPNDNEKLNVF